MDEKNVESPPQNLASIEKDNFQSQNTLCPPVSLTSDTKKPRSCGTGSNHTAVSTTPQGLDIPQMTGPSKCDDLPPKSLVNSTRYFDSSLLKNSAGSIHVSKPCQSPTPSPIERGDSFMSPAPILTTELELPKSPSMPIRSFKQTLPSPGSGSPNPPAIPTGSFEPNRPSAFSFGETSSKLPAMPVGSFEPNQLPTFSFGSVLTNPSSMPIYSFEPNHPSTFSFGFGPNPPGGFIFSPEPNRPCHQPSVPSPGLHDRPLGSPAMSTRSFGFHPSPIPSPIHDSILPS